MQAHLPADNEFNAIHFARRPPDIMSDYEQIQGCPTQLESFSYSILSSCLCRTTAASKSTHGNSLNRPSANRSYSLAMFLERGGRAALQSSHCHSTGLTSFAAKSWISIGKTCSAASACKEGPIGLDIRISPFSQLIVQTKGAVPGKGDPLRKLTMSVAFFSILGEVWRVP